jgi:hypothetical protein
LEGTNNNTVGCLYIYDSPFYITQPKKKVGKSFLDTHGVDGWGAKEVERGESLL